MKYRGEFFRWNMVELAAGAEGSGPSLRLVGQPESHLQAGIGAEWVGAYHGHLYGQGINGAVHGTPDVSAQSSQAGCPVSELVDAFGDHRPLNPDYVKKLAEPPRVSRRL